MRDLQSSSSMSSSCQTLVKTLTCAMRWHPSSFPSCSYPDRPDLALQRFLPHVDKHWWPSAGSGSLRGPFTERAATVSSSQRSVVVSDSRSRQLGTVGQKMKNKKYLHSCAALFCWSHAGIFQGYKHDVAAAQVCFRKPSATKRDIVRPPFLWVVHLGS